MKVSHKKYIADTEQKLAVATARLVAIQAKIDAAQAQIEAIKIQKASFERTLSELNPKPAAAPPSVVPPPQPEVPREETMADILTRRLLEKRRQWEESNPGMSYEDSLRELDGQATPNV